MITRNINLTYKTPKHSHKPNGTDPLILDNY